MRVLLVEDSPDLRHLFARVLKGSGFEVYEAANGREGIMRLRDGAFARAAVVEEAPAMASIPSQSR